jgi:hypothetical protein
MPRPALLPLLVLLAACAAEDRPPRWLGLADVEGRLVLPQGGEASRARLTWANLDRQRADRAQETGQATTLAADGSFTIASLPFGTYELTATYGDGTPRVQRLLVDQPHEQVELAVPAGAIVVAPPAGPRLRRVALKPFGAARWNERDDPPPGEPVRFDGLAPGHYLLSTVAEGNSWSHAVVRVEGTTVQPDLEPSGQGRLLLVVEGPLPEGTRNARLVVEAWAQAPGTRTFDFGAPGFSRATDERRSTHNVSAGTWGLLVLARDDEQGTLGAVAWVPDVAVLDDGETHVRVQVPELRPVRLTAGEGASGLAGTFSLRFGADVLPGRLLIDVEDQKATSLRFLLPTQDCAVVEGRGRRGEPRAETPVTGGPGTLEVATDGAER